MLTRTDYTDARSRGFRPRMIRRWVELWNAWEAEREAGRVRILACPDLDFSECTDWEGFRDEPGANLRALARMEKEQAWRVENYGAWGFVAQVRACPFDEWTEVDSIWGIVPDRYLPLGAEVHRASMESYTLELGRFEEPSGCGCEWDLLHAALHELNLSGEGQ